MTDHTKGPWIYCSGDRLDSPHIATFHRGNEINKIRIATCDMASLRQAFAISGKNIANKEITEAGYDFSTNTEEANARRIAAAVNATEGINILDLESGVVGELLTTLKALTDAVAGFENAIDNRPGRGGYVVIERATKLIRRIEGGMYQGGFNGKG